MEEKKLQAQVEVWKRNFVGWTYEEEEDDPDRPWFVKELDGNIQLVVEVPLDDLRWTGKAVATDEHSEANVVEVGPFDDPMQAQTALLTAFWDWLEKLLEQSTALPRRRR